RKPFSRQAPIAGALGDIPDRTPMSATQDPQPIAAGPAKPPPSRPENQTVRGDIPRDRVPERRPFSGKPALWSYISRQTASRRPRIPDMPFPSSSSVRHHVHQRGGRGESGSQPV